MPKFLSGRIYYVLA